MVLNLGMRQPRPLWLFLTSLALLAERVTSSSDGQALKLEEPPADHPFITGFYGPKPRIHIEGGPGKEWDWDTSSGLDNVPQELVSCIQRGESATEVKFASKGQKVLAVIGGAAVMINHAPGQPNDKMVDFAVCLNGELGNAHTLELLPKNLLAIATTGQTSDAGVWVYDASEMVASPEPTQKLPGVRAIHGMLWDQETQTLWATGNTDAADGSGGVANGTVQGYKYDEASNMLSMSQTFTMPSALNLDAEWKGGAFEKWWDGPHDLVPVPSTRILLIPTDRDLHALDLSTGEFDDNGEQLEQIHLPGFRPIGDRTADDGTMFPRSDIKSISLHEDGSVLYTQAEWKDESGLPSEANYLNPSGTFSPLFEGQTLYRSRWFSEVPGWPTN